MPVHGTWRMLRAMPSWPPVPAYRKSQFCWPNGARVDLVAGKPVSPGAVPVGKMFVDGFDRRRRRRSPWASGSFVVGLCQTVVVRSWHRPATLAAPHLHSRGFSEDPMRKVEAELECWWPPTSPTGSDRSRCATVGKWWGNTPPADCADGHRKLAHSSRRRQHHSICALRLRPVGST